MTPLALRRTFRAAAIPPLIWGMAAVAAGLLIALLPPWNAAVILGAAAALGAAFFSPVSSLTLLLVLAPLRTLYATEAPRLGWPNIPLDIGQWLAAAFFAAWALSRLFPPQTRPARLHWPMSLLPLAVFTVTAALSAYSAFSMGAWLTESLKYVQMLIIALLSYDVLRTVPRSLLPFPLVIAALANAIIGIYQYFGGSGALHLVINERFFRAFGTFGQPNPFGGYMGLIAPIALMAALASFIRLWHGLRQRRRLTADAGLLVFYGFAGLVLSVALVLSWSRGAWLAFGGALAVMLVALPRKPLHSLILLAGAALLVAGLAWSGRLPASITARLSTIGEELFNVRDVRGVDITAENYAVIERLAHWQAAINMATDHPWTGVGLGNYEVAYPQYRLINWKFALGHAHNMYLNMLAETGILGLSAYLAFLLSVLWYSWRLRRHPDPTTRLLGIGILGAWVDLCIHSLTDNLYVNNLFVHIGVILGLLALLQADLIHQRSLSKQGTAR